GARGARRVQGGEVGGGWVQEGGRGDLRETVADAEGLGRAAAESKPPADPKYEAVPGPAPNYFRKYKAARPPRVTEPPLAEEALGYEPPSPTPQSYDEDEDIYTRPPRPYGGIIKPAIMLAVLACIAGAAYWQRDALSSMVA